MGGKFRLRFEASRNIISVQTEPTKRDERQAMTINDKWDELHAYVMDADSSPARVEAIKSAFYGGALASVHLIIDSGTNTEATKVFRQTIKECKAYFTEQGE